MFSSKNSYLNSLQTEVYQALRGNSPSSCRCLASVRTRFGPIRVNTAPLGTIDLLCLARRCSPRRLPPEGLRCPAVHAEIYIDIHAHRVRLGQARHTAQVDGLSRILSGTLVRDHHHDRSAADRLARRVILAINLPTSPTRHTAAPTSRVALAAYSSTAVEVQELRSCGSEA